MLSFMRNGKRDARRSRGESSSIERLEGRQLLTATPTLIGATENITGGYATLWIDSTADSGSATITLQYSTDGGTSWHSFGTTSGGGNTWCTRNLSVSGVSKFSAMATQGGVNSSNSNAISVESSIDTPVAPTVENASNDGSAFHFDWTASVAYRDTDTLRLEWASGSSGTGGTVWNAYSTTNAATTAPSDTFSVNDQQTTQFRVRAENSNGNSGWTTFTINGV